MSICPFLLWFTALTGGCFVKAKGTGDLICHSGHRQAQSIFRCWLKTQYFCILDKQPVTGCALPGARHDRSATVPPALRTVPPVSAHMAATGLGMAVSLGDSVGPLHRAHIHEGSQLPGGSTIEFRLDWTHTFGTMRLEVKAGVAYIDGQPVQAAVSALAVPRVASRQD